ncbi:MAG: ABC transporter substrate-binding protein [Acidimicrobiales bacterium]|nr:ABC transporter substrate-binding protein [Acidimicrobiales bacterium]
MRKSARLAALLTPLLITAAACGGSDDGGDEASGTTTAASETGSTTAEGGEATEAQGCTGDEAFTIGYISDLVGPFGGLSNNILVGVEAHLKEVNDAGGVLGCQVKLEVRDDRNDVQTAVGYLDEMETLEVPVVLGNVSSVVWATTGPLAAEKEIVHIAGGAVDSLVYPPQPYLYRYLMSSRQSAEGSLQFALDQLGSTEPKISFLRYDSAGTDAYAEALVEALERNDLELAGDQQRFPAAATDLTPAASAIAAQNPNFVLSIMTDAQAPLGVEALRNRGYTGPIVNWVGISEKTLQAVNDPNFYVMRDTVPSELPESAYIKDLATELGKADKVNHDFAVNGYLSALATTKALEACGYPCSGADLNEALQSLGEIDAKGSAGPGWGVSEESHLFTTTVSLWHLEAKGDKASVLAGDWFEPKV